MSIKKPCRGVPSRFSQPPPGAGLALPYPRIIILSYQTTGAGETFKAGTRRLPAPATIRKFAGSGEN